MARKQLLQWDVNATIPVLQEVRFGKRLPAGVTLSSITAADIRVEQLTDRKPRKVWTDRTAEVTIANVTIETDTVNGNLANAAVRFTIIRSDLGSSQPEPGRNYRYWLEATRSDGRAAIADPDLHILP